MTWVLFSEAVSEEISNTLGAAKATPEDLKFNSSRSVEKSSSFITELVPTESRKHFSSAPILRSLPDAALRLLGRSQITAGNLINNHFYLTSFLDAFPVDAIGGRNQSEAAKRNLIVSWGGPRPVETDIDRTKNMFRKRGWVRQFFEAANAPEGDYVEVYEAAPYQIHARHIPQN